MKKLLLGLSVASLFALGGCSSVKRAYNKTKDKVSELVNRKKKGAETQNSAAEAEKQAEAKKK